MTQQNASKKPNIVFNGLAWTTVSKSAGVVLAKGQRFGLHNLRHSLSTWLVNKGKVDPKTVQGMLRHSDIRTTMNLYTQDDRDEKQAAQGAFLSAVGLGSRLVQ